MLEQYFSNPTKRTKQITSVLVVLIVAIVGTYLLVGSHAATPYASITADKGALAGGATKQSCSGASDGSCVMFGSTSTTGGKLRVSVDGTTGWGAAIPPVSGYPGNYVSDLFTDIGVKWNRGGGLLGWPSETYASDMSVISNDAYPKNPAMKTFLIYGGGTDSDDNGDGMTTTTVTNDMNNMIPLMNAYW